jgi:hypothetical protein
MNANNSLAFVCKNPGQSEGPLSSVSCGTRLDSLACVPHWYARSLIITATPVGSSLLSGNPVTDVVRAADNVHAFQLARSQETHHIEVNDRYFLQVQDTVGPLVSELVRQFREVL